MDSIEERIQKLERRLRDGIIVGGVLGLCLVIFAGYTWQDIPKKVTDAINNEVIANAKNKAQKYAEEAKKASSIAKESASQAKIELNLAKSFVAKVEQVESSKIAALEKRFSKNILWGVNAKNNIFWSEDKGENWHRVSGSLKQVSVGDVIVWGVNAIDEIYWSNDKDASWNRVNGKLKQISTWP